MSAKSQTAFTTVTAMFRPRLVVGMGIFAGGVGFCRRLLSDIPSDCEMAIIILQSLGQDEPDLSALVLAGNTQMSVFDATEGMSIQRSHVYIVPRGVVAVIANGLIRLSQHPRVPSEFTPIDHLLSTLAANYAPTVAGIVLSDDPTTGRLGLQAITDSGGLAIVRAPDPAARDDPSQGALLVTAFDRAITPDAVLQALTDSIDQAAQDPTVQRQARRLDVEDALSTIVQILLSKTSYDFRHYKPGTLYRRIGRRINQAEVNIDSVNDYAAYLENHPDEIMTLAKDLLINVTAFFRDPEVFAYLAGSVLPQIVRDHPVQQPIRVWIAACSSGEEAYSLAILFTEAIEASGRPLKLQIFASDLDADSITIARRGVYPDSIAEQISPSRISRFFSRKNNTLHVSADLRANIIFAVQDILTDPPFSRIDFVSCRNLLIYLRRHAQMKAMLLFLFALSEGGILMLGRAETVGALDDRFDALSKPYRIYRQAGGSRPTALHMVLDTVASPKPQRLVGAQSEGTRPETLESLCQGVLVDAFAPPSVLIDRQFRCRFLMGDTSLYIATPPGPPTTDLLAMVNPPLRARLRLAVQRALHAAVAANGAQRVETETALGGVRIDVRPLRVGAEALLLVSFVEPQGVLPSASGSVDETRIAELERELDALRESLKDAASAAEASLEERETLAEEALSINEEFHTTNEELITSQEELQSLNDELAALNNELQETLEKSRVTSEYLKNVLSSTLVATIFLSPALTIMFFTPSTERFFNVRMGDVGRPLTDLASLARDAHLTQDARTVLAHQEPIERDIEIGSGKWFLRRVLPYRTDSGQVEGVVITFTDVTERKHAAQALEEARSTAERSTVAKTRFLAAASHDLRQPLQNLQLLQGLMARASSDEAVHALMMRFDTALNAMSGMLNALLDVNRIGAGVVQVNLTPVPIQPLMARLDAELSGIAETNGVDLRTIKCGLSVTTDPMLLEQILRNFLSNALKYTERGRILFGCRRRGEVLSIEVWDTGIGIPHHELPVIFDEYHQVANAVRTSNKGMGLGLTIVRHLAELLGHSVRVDSQLHRGSSFAIDVPIAAVVSQPAAPMGMTRERPGEILVVGAEPDLRHLLTLTLQAGGHRVVAVPDSAAAVDVVRRDRVTPDLAILDFGQADGTGLAAAAALRATLGFDVPILVLSGDASADALQAIAAHPYRRIDKPIKPDVLLEVIEQIIDVPADRQPPRMLSADAGLSVIVIDDDPAICSSFAEALQDLCSVVQTFDSGEAFLAADAAAQVGCVLIDAYLPGISGLDLLRHLVQQHSRLIPILVTGRSDVSIAISAMKAGALDFLEKPVGTLRLRASVEQALLQADESNRSGLSRDAAAAHIKSLSRRQRQILELVVDGMPSKNIAADLNISQRTVENHRAAIMRKMGVRSISALMRVTFTAGYGKSAEGVDGAPRRTAEPEGAIAP
ncbi:MAG: response regulator [Alphaproteobacteria bacterium]|nr:MAG: response regulator [Alphaproteobacteria bacterium]